MLDGGFDRPDTPAGLPEDLLVPSTSAPSAAPQDRSFHAHLCSHESVAHCPLGKVHIVSRQIAVTAVTADCY